MRKLINLLTILFASVTLMLACSDDKSSLPTGPQDQGISLTLIYQNYAYTGSHSWHCIRLMMDDHPLDQCDLGESSQNLGARTYAWQLYAISDMRMRSTNFQMATGTVTLDRNRVCIVDSNTVTWR
jgi:hypothetical protein